MPLSLTFDDASGNCGASANEVSSETWKVRRSRLLTPTISAPDRRARSSSPRIVNFHQRRHSKFPRQFAKVPELGFVENRGNQQDGVRADGSGFDDVIVGDDEILADDRQIAGGAGGPEIGNAALEEVAIGKDGDRRGAAFPYCLASSAGWKSSTRTPLLGEAFLISAMIAGRFARSAAAKSRRSAWMDRAIRRKSAA